MKMIMVGVDFSDASYGALNYAKQLARCFSAKILLVHVIDDMHNTPEMEQPKASYPQRMDSAEEALQKIAAGLSTTLRATRRLCGRVAFRDNCSFD